MSTIDSEMLRSLVREALRDALGSNVSNVKLPIAPVAQPAVTEVVSLNNDSDLAAFVRRVLDMSQDAGTLAQLREGKITFQLAGSHSSGSTNISAATQGMRVEKGALTESMVRKAAESGNAIYLNRKVVVTALARDKARAMGVELIRDTQENQKGTVNR